MNRKISIEEWLTIDSTGGKVVENFAPVSVGKSSPLNGSVFGVKISHEVKTMRCYAFCDKTIVENSLGKSIFQAV